MITSLYIIISYTTLVGFWGDYLWNRFGKNNFFVKSILTQNYIKKVILLALGGFIKNWLHFCRRKTIKVMILSLNRSMIDFQNNLSRKFSVYQFKPPPLLVGQSAVKFWYSKMVLCTLYQYKLITITIYKERCHRIDNCRW